MPGQMDDILKSLLDTGDTDLTKIAEELSTEFLVQKKNQQKIAASLEEQGRRIARGFVTELNKLGFGHLANRIGKRADEMISPAVEQPSNVTEMPDPNLVTGAPTGGTDEESLGSVLSELGVSTEGLSDLGGQTSAGGEITRGPAEPSEEEAAVKAVETLLEQTSAVSPEAAVASQATSAQAANVAETDATLDAALQAISAAVGEEAATTPEEVVESAIGEETPPETISPEDLTTEYGLGSLASDPYDDLYSDPYGALLARSYLRNLGWF